jgi:hypothetical protein
LTIVTLDQAAQKFSGVEVAALATASSPTEYLAYGTAFDIQPLIDAHTRHSTSQAELDAAQATVDAVLREADRDRVQYAENRGISLSELETAQSAATSAKAKLQVALANLQFAQASALQQFGAPLAHWVTTADSPELRKILSREDVLLRVVVPLGVNLTAPEKITVDSGEPSSAASGHEAAHLISVSPQTDPAMQGRTYFYRTSADLPIGSKVIAYLPAGDETASSVFVPGDAIVWFGGQPWAYTQLGVDRFARRPVAEKSPRDGGFLVNAGFKAGEVVVTHGAQLLLSEEQRPQITGSACKDPECDD